MLGDLGIKEIRLQIQTKTCNLTGWLDIMYVLKNAIHMFDMCYSHISWLIFIKVK